MWEIRDEKGEVFNRVKEPAVVFDRETGTIYKIGEYEVMEEYFNRTQTLYRSQGFGDIADEMILMELPGNQQIIDRVFQISGYVKRLYEENIKTGN